jgi:hypothetical protein
MPFKIRHNFAPRILIDVIQVIHPSEEYARQYTENAI